MRGRCPNNWFTGSPSAWTAIRAGGTWTFDWPPHLQAKGQYLTVDRPNRLVCTRDQSIQHSRQGPDPAHGHLPLTLDSTFTATGDAGTRLHVIESGHADDAIVEMNASGVDQALTTLRAFLEDGLCIDWTALPPASE
jgi:uncharacterized protein YndB with AHSA1/START domain